MNFNNLKLITIEIENQFNNIKNKNEYIKNIHSRYLTKLDINDNYKISLDILNYQSTLILLEYNKNHDFYSKFINNMYGSYFKLYSDIIDFNRTESEKINLDCKTFDNFNELDDNIKFNINDCENIFNTIYEYLIVMYNYIKLQNEEIKIDKITKQSGIYLNNFINEKEYNINIVKEKINLFLNNLISYYDFHYNFLKRLLYKLILEKNYIDNKINSNINNNTNFKNLINKYKIFKNEENLIKNINLPKFFYIKSKYFLISSLFTIILLSYSFSNFKL